MSLESETADQDICTGAGADPSHSQPPMMISPASSDGGGTTDSESEESSNDAAGGMSGGNPLMSYFDTDESSSNNSGEDSSGEADADAAVAAPPAEQADEPSPSTSTTSAAAALVVSEPQTEAAREDQNDSMENRMNGEATPDKNEVDVEDASAKSSEPAADDSANKVEDLVKQPDDGDQPKKEEGDKEESKATLEQPDKKPKLKKQKEATVTDDNDKPNPSPDSTTATGDQALVPLSPNSLYEAERQAAIAAAISANSTSMSPSVAAGIAKVLALPGLMSDKVSEMSDTASSMANAGRNVASGMAAGVGAGGNASGRQYPPPPPRNNAPGQYGPTMVALPPPAYPMQGGGGKGRGTPMRPARFEDVKVAFGELLSKELVKEENDEVEVEVEDEVEVEVDSKAEKESESKLSTGEPKDKQKDENNEKIEGESSEAEADDTAYDSKNLLDGEDSDEEGGENKSSPVDASDKSPENEGVATSLSTEKAAEKDKAKDESTSNDNTSDSDENNESSLEKTTSETILPDAPKSESPLVKKENVVTIPDSFLRFLLLVARVPIIIEEHKNAVPSSPRKDKAQKSEQKEDEKLSKKARQKVPPAAIAAAKRAYEILCMAQRSYEVISDRQHQNSELDSSGKRRDATTSFFAACAGEHVQEVADGGNFDGHNISKAVPAAAVANGEFNKGLPPPSPPASLISSTTASTSASTATSSTTPLTAASSMASSASAVFSNVMSKMAIPKKQSSFSDIGKKFIPGDASRRMSNEKINKSSLMAKQQTTPPTSPPAAMQHMEDYEILINNEMLGLTVENVLERTIIRTLLPDGAAKHAGAQVGSLIAKVGNVDTSNLTHFETIDELRRSQRPLKLTLRHVGGNVLRRAREEMGRLIRGHGLTAATSSGGEDVDGGKPWREQKPAGETLDSVLANRWPSRSNKSSLVSGASASAPPLAMTRGESMHQAGKNLIRILALLVVGLEKELSSLNSEHTTEVSGRSHMSVKELSESIEISSKILLDYARGLPDVDEKSSRSPNSSGNAGNKPHQMQGSSFYPVPPGRVQGKKHGTPPGGAGRGKGSQRGKKQPSNSPLLRIGDALQRTRSFLVESSSITSTSLRWEIIDYLCVLLDLDTEQELSEQESASQTTSTGGKTEGGGSSGNPMNDLGAAGSILKLIVLNCSTNESRDGAIVAEDGSDSESQSSLDQSSLDQSSRSVNTSASGNCFLSVVHRLAASKSTSARVSACSLGPVLWSHLDFPRQLQLRGVVTRALHDVEVIVRKSTAAVLHEVAELVFDRRAVPWLVLMCERSMTDPEPQLRAAAMTLTWHLAEHLPNAFLGDASKGSRSLRRLPPRDSPTFMDVYLLQCKLFPVANNLAEDRVASVRLSVAAQCDRLCNALGEHWFSVIIDLLQALLSDGDERVRSEAILCMPRLVESVIVGTSNGQGNITVLESLLPLAFKTQKDSSPVVRSSLATATGELLIFLVGLGGGGCNETAPPSPGRSISGGVAFADHKQHVDDTLIPILQKLLQDTDPEVTTASLRAVTNASRSGTARDTSTMIPSCSHKFNDSSASNNNIDDDLVSLSSHGTHHSHQSHLSHERTKPVFIPVLSEKQVLRLLPTLSNLATSTQWRVRQSAVEIVPALMGCTHRHETRHEISKLCLRLMNDKVDAVRKTAAECLCLGGSSLARHGEEDGGEWIKMIVIPHLRTCSKSEDSKQRLLSLKMIEIIITNGLCPTMSSHNAAENASPPRPVHDDDESTTSSVITDGERPARMILNIAASHTSDTVANVRLNVGRTLGAIMVLLDRSDVDFALETLEKQLEEETSRPGGGDRDVVYFARQAISTAQPLRRMSSTLSNN